jgi:hypothetical protein
MPKVSQNRKDECRAALLKIVKPKDKIYCVLRHVARSGMMRKIDFYKMDKDGPRYLSNYIADLLEYRNDRDGVVVSGYGMDMGFAVVYAVGAVLWPKGIAKPHGTRNGEPDSTGGYALKSEWL